MSNSQKQISDLMHEWGVKMQESMKDSRLSDLMTDYYNQYQKIIQDMHNETKANNAAQASDENDANAQILKLSERISQLENKIKILERVICTNIK